MARRPSCLSPSLPPSSASQVQQRPSSRPAYPDSRGTRRSPGRAPRGRSPLAPSRRPFSHGLGRGGQVIRRGWARCGGEEEEGGALHSSKAAFGRRRTEPKPAERRWERECEKVSQAKEERRKASRAAGKTAPLLAPSNSAAREPEPAEGGKGAGHSPSSSSLCRHRIGRKDGGGCEGTRPAASDSPLSLRPAQTLAPALPCPAAGCWGSNPKPPPASSGLPAAVAHSARREPETRISAVGHPFTDLQATAVGGRGLCRTFGPRS